jgi:CheY-like chemotaxis protein
MAPKILVVDRNEAFSTMLKQMLETDGSYAVRVVHTGSDGLKMLRQEPFDLTIIDMDLDRDDMGYHELILKVRQLQPTMRLMLIPLMGGELPREVQQLAIQGTLSKPFFADDLLPTIKDVLVQPFIPSTVQPIEPPSPSRRAGQASSDVQAVLSDLARETNAEAVLLLSTAHTDPRVIAQVSSLAEAKLETLAELSLATFRTAQEAASFLGQPDDSFKHNMFEGDSTRLYMMTLPENMLLTVITPIRTSLGTIRHNLRRAARGLLETVRT